MSNADADTRMSSATTCRTASGNPISIESSGLDAITFATLFNEHGVQVKCPGGCMAPVTGSTHHCMTCGHSIHCAILCGQEYAQWFEKSIKIGLDPSMLPPHGQSKLAQYSGVPPDHQAICNYCIKSLESKMTMKQPSSSTRRISPTSSLSFDTTEDEEDDIDVVGAAASRVRPPSLPALAQFFHDGKQTLCAATGVCKQPGGYDLPSIHDQSLCVVCDLAMHKKCAVNYREWVVKTADQERILGSAIAAMFPPNARDKISTAFPDQSRLVICLRCVKDIEDANFIGIGSTTTSTADAAAGGGKKKRASKKKKAAPAVKRVDTAEGIDWDKIIPSITWENVVMSATACNPLMSRKKDLFTKLKGFRIGDKLVEIFDIQVIALRDLAKQIGVEESVGSLKKPVIVDLVIQTQERKEREKLTGVVVPNNVVYDAVRCIWNVPRIINIIFSGEFKDRFANRGHHLTKEQLDAGIRSDQELFTDLGIAYNDGSVEHYGILADVGVSIVADPAKFHPIDSSNWAKTKSFVGDIFKEYEKTLLRWRVSGTHGTYSESLPNIKPNKDATVMMVYMHHHMCKNPSLLEQCAGLLDPDTAFETVPGGGLNSRTSTGRKSCSGVAGMRSGSLHGEASGGKKQRKRKSVSIIAEKANTGNDYIGALTYNATVTGEKIDMETTKFELESEKLRQDISQQKLKDVRDSLVYYGQMKEAAIEKRRDRMEQIKKRYGDELARSKIEEARERRKEKGNNCFSLSQDSLIGQYLDCEKTIINSTRDEQAAEEEIEKIRQEKEK